MNRTALAHAIAIAAALLAIIATTAAWIVNLRSGPRLGLEEGAFAIFLPVGLLLLFGMWLVARGILLRGFRWTALLVLAASLGLATIVTAISCGPIACFQASPNRYMGWFLVLGSGLAAVLHHLALADFKVKKTNGN